MRSLARAAVMLAAATAPLMAQGKPVIAVLYFDNNSIGKDHADYDGVGKGIADMLITDMASNPNVKIVERDRIQALLTEQNLTKEKTIDPQTAIRLGKIIGAQYMILGGFMSDGRGNYVLTSRAVNVETSAITNPVRLSSKGDDVLGLIAQLSTKLNTEMKLPALQVGQAGMPAGEQKSDVAVAKADTKADTKADMKADMPKAEAKADMPKADMKADRKETRVAKAESKPAGKMDMRTAMLYSKALEEEDAGNRTKAVELYKQVVAKFPLPAAQEKINKLSRG